MKKNKHWEEVWEEICEVANEMPPKMYTRGEFLTVLRAKLLAPSPKIK